MYNSENPFEFMKYIDVENKANFFEERNTEYGDASIGNTREFVTDADF